MALGHNGTRQWLPSDTWCLSPSGASRVPGAAFAPAVRTREGYPTWGFTPAGRSFEMTPYFIGIGTPDHWRGVGVVRDGGERKELVRTVAYLAHELGGVPALLTLAMSAPDGWATLLPPTRLTSSSGAFPLRMDAHRLSSEFAGDHNGVFLASDPLADLMTVWIDGHCHARIRSSGDAVEVEWSGGEREAVDEPTKAILERDATAARRAERGRPAVFIAAAPPPQFAAEINGYDPLRSMRLRLAVRRIVGDLVRPTLDATTSGVPCLRADAESVFAMVSFDGIGVGVAVEPVAGPRLGLSIWTASGEWIGPVDSLALNVLQDYRDTGVRPEDVDFAFRAALRACATRLDAEPLQWREVFARTVLVPNSPTSLRFMNAARALLLLWASDPVQVT